MGCMNRDRNYLGSLVLGGTYMLSQGASKATRVDIISVHDVGDARM